MFPTFNIPPTRELAACVLFTLLSLLSRSTGEHSTSELAFDGVCMMWEGGSVLGVTYFLRRQGPFGLMVLPLILLPPSSVSVSLCFPTAPARLHA